MIELKDVKLSGKNSNNEPLNLKFSNGLNFLSYDNSSLFKALILKDQLFSEGTFIVNNVTFFPNDSNDKTILVLAINSKVFCLTISLISSKKEKKILMNEVQDKLFALKEMPLETLEDKEKKIDAIFDVISSYELGYALIDYNNDINIENLFLINKKLEQYKDKATFIILENEPLMVSDKFDEIDVNGDEENIAEDKNTSNKKIKINKEIWKDVFNKNLSTFVLIGLEALFSVFSSSLCPYYFSINNVLWGVIFLFILFICLFAEMIFLLFAIEYSADKKLPKQKEYDIASITYLSSFVFLGIICSYILFFVLKTNNIIINQEDYNSVTIILSIIVSLVCLAFAIFSKQIYRLFIEIKKKIANRNNSH